MTKKSWEERSKSLMNSWFYTCGRCGKEFLKAPEHLYKKKINNKIMYYCSYTCWMNSEKGI